jgi:hypothetical protein
MAGTAAHGTAKTKFRIFFFLLSCLRRRPLNPWLRSGSARFRLPQHGYAPRHPVLKLQSSCGVGGGGILTAR